MRKLFVVLFFIIMSFTAIPVRAAVVSVGTPAELANAINTAFPGDTISFTADITLTAVDNVTNGNNGLPVITISNVTIDGNGFTLRRDPAAPDFRLLYFVSRLEYTVQNLTLENGLATGTTDAGYGGAIYHNIGSLGLINVTINDNRADWRGGAIYTTGFVQIIDSTLNDNDSYHGGAIYNSGSNLEIENSILSGNEALVDGGAIYSSGAEMTIIDSTIDNNVAGDRGGGININSGLVEIASTTISGNLVSGDGGAIYSSSADMTITDSTIDNNQADGVGGIFIPDGVTNIDRSTISNNVADHIGGIANGLGTLTMSNSTVSGNEALFSGGILNGGTMLINNSTIVLNETTWSTGGGIVNDGTVSLTNSIVSGNGNSPQCENITGSIITNGNNILGHSGDSGGCPVGASDIVPAGALNTILNTTLADNSGATQTHALVNNSPAMDASGVSATTEDQRGETAIGIRDIGAFEVTSPRVSFTITPTSLNEGNTATVTVTLTNYVASPVDINFAFSGTADASDYSITGSSNLTFTGNGSQSFTITALDDGNPESLEDLILTMIASIPITIAGTNPQTITISDAGIVLPPPTTAPVNNAAPAIALFDPSISKIGFLVPGQVGVTGEQLQWSIIVRNTGSVAGNNVVITDLIDSRLQINSVVAPGATVDIQGQQVRIIYSTIQPGETQQSSIFTTVLDGEEINNTACVDANNQGAVECATGMVITELPQTGEAPFARNHWLLATLLFSLAMIVFQSRRFMQNS